MKDRLFDSDYNRPLSIQEQNIAARLECEPYPNPSLGALVQDRAAVLQSARTKRGSVGRRSTNARSGTKGAKSAGQRSTGKRLA